MNSGHILHAVARHLNWRQGVLVPEAMVEYSRGVKPRPWGSGTYDDRATYLADLMWVTRDQYATEIEIKVSRSDWRADSDKAKWAHLPPWISRFVYAVPRELGIPEWVSPLAGVWHVASERGCLYVEVVRAPRRIGKDKVPDKTLAWWKSHLYYRYWYNLLHGPRREMPAVPADALAKQYG